MAGTRLERKAVLKVVAWRRVERTGIVVVLVLWWEVGWSEDGREGKLIVVGRTRWVVIYFMCSYSCFSPSLWAAQ